MTGTTKAALLLGALVLAAVSGGVYGVIQARGRAAAIHQAAVLEGVIHTTQQSETTAKTDCATAWQLVRARDQDVARLQAQLAQHPRTGPAQPVPPDASAALVMAGLQSLGLQPQIRDDPLPITLTLSDGRTTLAWGREALRVPSLTARMTTLDDLTRAQAEQSAAQRQQQAATDRALEAADARADAQAERAGNLQRAIDLTPRFRLRSAGVIISMEPNGTRHLGAYATRSWGPIEVGALYLNNQAGVIAAYRF